MNLAGIYKIERKASGKCYIGQSTDILRRWRSHINDAYSAAPSSGIARAIKKYGPEAFYFSIEVRMNEKLSPAYLRKKLKTKEKQLVAKYNSFHKGYNGDEGGR